MRILAFLIALLAPVPALALSCLSPSVERSYAQFHAEEDSYVVVHGRLTLDASKLPTGMTADRDPPRMTLIPAKLRGTSLNAKGFVLPFEQEVTLEVRCLGPWCGGVQNGEDVLAFVRKDAKGYAINVGPCGGSVFGMPKATLLKRVQQCMTQQNCTLD